MAMNQFEFMGNDRYFKYKYAQEVPVNVTVTTIEESWETEKSVSWSKMMEDYFKRSLNIKLIFEGYKVPFIDVPKLSTAPEFLNNGNVIMIAKPRSFFDGRQDYFSPTPAFETVRTIIVSAAPKKVTSTSLSFLNMDSPVVIITGLTLVLLSLLLVIHSIVINKYKSLHKKKIVKKLAQETLGNIWENASLLCAEPIPSVLPHITCRLLAASWLIGVTFILFFLGCYLRTEFTTESYNRIDTLSDLIKSGIPPTMIMENGVFDYLKCLATRDKVVREWLDALDHEKLFSTMTDYTKLDGYIPIISGEKSLITVDPYMIWIMTEFLRSGSESKMFLVEKGGLYFSQNDLGFDYSHFILNSSWLRSSPQLHENLQLIIEPLFETQFFKYLYFEKYYIMEHIMWKRPMKSTTDLDLSSVVAPFYLLFTLLSGTVVAVLTEKFFNRFA